MAWLVASVSTLSALFLGEVMGYTPCVLCWYQRILIYPLALLIPIGILRRDPKAHTYILPFALICIPMSAYHHLLQRTHWFDQHTVCRHGTPCSALYIDWFGFIDIPTLALFAALIIALATSAWARGGSASVAATAGRPWRPVLACIGATLAFYAIIYRVVR